MALENPALNERSFQRGIEEAGAEPRTMSASGTYAITGLLLVIVVAVSGFRLLAGRDRQRGRTTRGLDPRLDLARLLAHLHRRHRWRLRLQGRADHLRPVRLGRGLAAWHRFPLLRPAVRRDRLAGASRHALRIPCGLPPLQPAHRQGHLAIRDVGCSGDGRRSCCSIVVAWLLSLLGVDLRFLYAPTPLGIGISVLIVILGSAESDARFRLHREGSGGGRAEVHAVVRRLRADALADLDLRLRSAAHRATSIKRVGDDRKQAAMSSRKGETNRDNG